MRPESASSSVHAPPVPQATWRRTSTGTGTPSPMGRSSTPSPPEEAPTPSGTRAARPSLSGTRSPIPARGGPSGSTHPSASPGTTTHWTPRRTGPGPSVAGDKRPKSTRFVTTRKGDQVLDEASLARARRLAGLKGYVTNMPTRLMDAAEVVSSYHELWHARAVIRR